MGGSINRMGGNCSSCRLTIKIKQGGIANVNVVCVQRTFQSSPVSRLLKVLTFAVVLIAPQESKHSNTVQVITCAIETSCVSLLPLAIDLLLNVLASLKVVKSLGAFI